MMNNFKKWTLIFLGFLMFISYIWFRFIRVRLPRDIPFNLSFFGLLLLIYIILIYAYIINAYLQPPRKIEIKKTTSPYIIGEDGEKIYAYRRKDIEEEKFPGSQILDFFLTPLYEFDSQLKLKFPFITNLFIKIGIYILNKEKIFIITLTIIPRLLLLIALWFDTFYFHKLENIYKILLVGFLILLEKYIKFSINKAYEDILIYEDIEERKYTINMKWEYADAIMRQYYIDNGEDPDDGYVENGLYPVRITRFLDFQTNYYIENGEYAPFSGVSISYFGIKEVRISLKQPENGTTDEQDKIRRREIDKREIYYKNLVKDLLKISLMLERLKIIKNIFKKLKLLIFMNYLIIWIYILIVSLPNLHLDLYYDLLMKILENYNPFND